MATTKRVTIGHVECPACTFEGRTRRARVATNVKGNLFYACDGDEEYAGCGINHMGYRGGQAWLRKHTVFLPGFEHFKNAATEPVVEIVQKESKTPSVLNVDTVTVAPVVEKVIKKVSWLDKEIF